MLYTPGAVLSAACLLPSGLLLNCCRPICLRRLRCKNSAAFRESKYF